MYLTRDIYAFVKVIEDLLSARTEKSTKAWKAIEATFKKNKELRAKIVRDARDELRMLVTDAERMDQALNVDNVGHFQG